MATSELLRLPSRQRGLAIGLGVILVGGLIWIIVLASGGHDRTPMTPPNVFAIEMRKRLASDPRFSHVEFQPDPSDPANVLVVGEVPDQAALADLTKAINPGNITVKLNMQVELARKPE